MAKRCRPYGRFFCWILMGILLGAMATLVHAARTTRVNDIVYRADGTAAKGTLVISWPAFTTSQGESVAAGRMSMPIGANGLVDVTLVPNTGSKPASYYTVVLKLDDGTSATEYWAVPVSASATVAAVRSKVVPAGVAVQAVGRDYVDSADAATKSYVDAAVHAASENPNGVALNPAGTQVVNQPAGTSLQVNRADFANANGVRYADRFARLQTAVDDAGTSGAVAIPPGYSGTDAFSNTNGRPIFDLRKLGDFRGGEISVKDFGAVGNSGFYPASNMTAGTNKVTLNPVWVIGNISSGTPILVAGAGPSGGDLSTTIVSYSNGTFTVAANASTTVAGRGVYWGTDDTAAVQAAINYCASAGGCTLKFPQGEYLISSVTVPAYSGIKNGRIALVGMGGRSATRIVGIGADQSAIISVAASGFPTEVRGLAFDSFDYQAKHSIAIDVLGGIEHHFTDNFFGNVYHAIRMTSTFLNTIDFNRFYGPWDSCIKFVSGASAVIDTTIDRNEFGVCGGSRSHGWALEQLSQGGGGSNWIRITNNDCEGTEWNGCWYLYKVTYPVVTGNRTEVDSKVADGTWRSLKLEDVTAGYFAKNELSGGVELIGSGTNNNVFTGNNYYPNSVTGVAFYNGGNGNTSVGESLNDSWISGGSNLTVIGSPSDTPLNLTTASFRILGYLGAANTRKFNLFEQEGYGFGRAYTQDYINNLPIGNTGSSLKMGDILYPRDNGYPPGGPKNNIFAWICAGGSSATCDWNGTTWTGAGSFRRSFYFSKFHAESNAVPTSGTWARGDHVWNTAPSGNTPVVAWVNTTGGTPGTFIPLIAFDPASPPAFGTTTPSPGAFSTLNAISTSTLGGDTGITGRLTVIQQVPSNPGIVVRASSSATPDQVNCGGACSLAFWVKTDSLSLSDGQSVTSWSDSSSGAHNVTAGTTAPVYKANVVNGKPVVRFSSSTNQMTTASFGITGAYTAFFVMQKAAGASGCFPLTDSGNENFYWQGATQLRILNGGGGAGYPSIYSSAVVDDLRFHQYASVVNVPNSYAYQDGVQVGINTTSTQLSNWNGGVKINNDAGSCTADIAEIVVFQGALGTADRQKVEAYLGTKYGIAASSQKLLDVQNSSGTNVAGVDVNGKMNANGVIAGFSNIAFSAAATFDASTANTFRLTLTGNVSSSSLVNAAAGQPLNFIICQDAGGSRTMTWPTNMTGAMTIGSVANKCSAQSFVFDGANAVATSPGVANQ